ncbi:MAG: response regulator [Pirellulaceae bacterium]
MSNGSPPLRKLRILIAEDTPANYRILEKVLTGRGHEVVVARNGKEALYCIFYGHFDVVVMDVQMPLLDGFEVARAVRQQEQSHTEYTPIVALTVHEGDADRARCLEAGMDEYLSKPLDAGQLIHTVEHLANGRRPSQPGSSEDGHRARRTSPTWTDKNIVDFDGCMRRLNGDLELFREFVEIFHEDSPGLVEAIRRGVALRDSVQLARAAHSLKGLTSNFGARGAVEAAKQLEEIGEQHRWADADAALELLDQSLARLYTELETFRHASTAPTTS